MLESQKVERETVRQNTADKGTTNTPKRYSYNTSPIGHFGSILFTPRSGLLKRFLIKINTHPYPEHNTKTIAVGKTESKFKFFILSQSRIKRVWSDFVLYYSGKNDRTTHTVRTVKKSYSETISKILFVQHRRYTARLVDFSTIRFPANFKNNVSAKNVAGFQITL